MKNNRRLFSTVWASSMMGTCGLACDSGGYANPCIFLDHFRWCAISHRASPGVIEADAGPTHHLSPGAIFSIRLFVCGNDLFWILILIELVSIWVVSECCWWVMSASLLSNPLIFDRLKSWFEVFVSNKNLHVMLLR